MVTERYKKYLKSEAWARKRAQAFAYYGKKCYVCHSRRNPIQIHHLTYVHLYNEPLRDLRPLCLTCHREVTRLHWKLGKRKVTGEQVFAVFLKQKRLNRFKK